MRKLNAKQESVVRFLRECPGSLLSSLLTEALKDRPENTMDALDESRLVLGEAHRSTRDDGGWGPWKIRAIASHDSSVYPLGNHGEPFCQYGTCSHCGLEVCSHIKDAVCPCCDTAVHLT